MVVRLTGPAARGRSLARELAAQVGVRATDVSRPTRPRILVTRPAEQEGELVSALRGVGIEPVLIPTLAIELEPGGGHLDAAARHLAAYAWVVITSANGARAFLKAAERVFTPFEASRFAAIGPASRAALEIEGVDVDFQPRQNMSSAMAIELPVTPGQRVIVVRGDLADGDLAPALRARGAEVADVIAYRAREGPDSSRSVLRAAVAEGPIAAVIFTSGSTIRGFLSLARQESIDMRSWPAVCVGLSTTEAAEAAGFTILAVSPTADAAALAAAAADALARSVT